MPEIDGQDEGQVREIAYFLWLQEGCPEGRADDHWMLACGMLNVQATEAPEDEAEASPPPGHAAPDTRATAEASAQR